MPVRVEQRILWGRAEAIDRASGRNKKLSPFVKKAYDHILKKNKVRPDDPFFTPSDVELQWFWNTLEVDRYIKTMESSQLPKNIYSVLETAAGVLKKKVPLEKDVQPEDVSRKKVKKSTDVPTHLKKENQKAWNKSALFQIIDGADESMKPLKRLRESATKTVHSSLKQ